MGAREMTTRVVEAMILVIEWAKQYDICEQFRGQGCTKCPLFVKDAPCGKHSTKWVLTRASEVFQDYIDFTKSLH
jgi:hypothetical protein